MDRKIQNILNLFIYKVCKTGDSHYITQNKADFSINCTLRTNYKYFSHAKNLQLTKPELPSYIRKKLKKESRKFSVGSGKKLN